jgi:hypothetical protein
MRLHEVFEVRAAEIFHRVVERAVGIAAVVEDRDGVWMRELRHRLHLALEAIERVRAEVRQHELDRGGPAEQGVVRVIDGAHAAFADLAPDGVLPELHRGGQLRAQAVDDVRADGREHDGHGVVDDVAGDERARWDLELAVVRDDDRARDDRDEAERRRDRGALRAARHEECAREHGERDEQQARVRRRLQVVCERRDTREAEPAADRDEQIEAVERVDGQRLAHQDRAPDHGEDHERDHRNAVDNVLVLRRDRVRRVHREQEQEQRRERPEHALREQREPLLEVLPRFLFGLRFPDGSPGAATHRLNTP